MGRTGAGEAEIRERDQEVGVSLDVKRLKKLRIWFCLAKATRAPSQTSPGGSVVYVIAFVRLMSADGHAVEWLRLALLSSDTRICGQVAAIALKNLVPVCTL